jgi:ABC-2 type transport system permease protein
MKRRYPDMLAIFRRELKAYFTSPIGFTFVGFFILIAGVFFAISNLLSGNPNFTGVLSNLTFIFLFLVPILTMRLISEETRQKTDQLLITSPVGITGIVMGKYLAAMGVFVITLVITLIYPVIMSFFALGGLAWWEILGGYIGFLLLGSSFIAVGLFFSSLTDSQIVAAVYTFAALLLIWILDFIAQSVPSDAVSGLVFLALIAAALVLLVYLSTRNTAATVVALVVAAAAVVLLYVLSRGSFEGLIGRILSWFSLLKRYSDFGMGVLGLAPIVYYISFSGAFVFLTIRMIEKRRWV